MGFRVNSRLYQRDTQVRIRRAATYFPWTYENMDGKLEPILHVWVHAVRVF